MKRGRKLDPYRKLSKQHTKKLKEIKEVLNNDIDKAIQKAIESLNWVE